MGVEYNIKFSVPTDYNPQLLLNRLPSSIHNPTMNEIYHYAIRDSGDGFYFIDNLVDKDTAAIAFKMFVDDALRVAAIVEISEA